MQRLGKYIDEIAMRPAPLYELRVLSSITVDYMWMYVYVLSRSRDAVSRSVYAGRYS